MRSFPHRTETDFYIWIVNYHRKKNNTEEESDQDVMPTGLAQWLVSRYSRKYAGWLYRLRGHFRRLLGLVKY